MSWVNSVLRQFLANGPIAISCPGKSCHQESIRLLVFLLDSWWHIQDVDQEPPCESLSRSCLRKRSGSAVTLGLRFWDLMTVNHETLSREIHEAELSLVSSCLTAILLDSAREGLILAAPHPWLVVTRETLGPTREIPVLVCVTRKYEPEILSTIICGYKIWFLPHSHSFGDAISWLMTVELSCHHPWLVYWRMVLS